MLLSSSRAFATEKLTASQWSHLSEQRKLYFIFGQMDRYEDEDVVFSGSARDYLEKLDTQAKSASPAADMDDVFQSVIEADSAAALPTLKKN